MRTSFAEIPSFLFRVERYVTLRIDILLLATSVLHRNVENKKLRNAELVSRGMTCLSLFCLSLIVALTFFYKPSGPPPARQLIMSVFMAICGLGAIAAVLPSKCSRVFQHRQVNDDQPVERNGPDQPNQPSMVLSGHHPACGNFESHVLQVRGKNYCAGCSGLLTGALIAVTGSFAYFLNVFIVHGPALFVFWAGFLAVLFGLQQYTRPLMSKSWIHYLLNVLLVVGAFLLLIGVIEINGTLAVETYLLLIIVYWISTRIVLSDQEHLRMCTACGFSGSCAYCHHWRHL